jgi:hypothetical protein
MDKIKLRIRGSTRTDSQARLERSDSASSREAEAKDGVRIGVARYSGAQRV